MKNRVHRLPDTSPFHCVQPFLLAAMRRQHLAFAPCTVVVSMKQSRAIGWRKVTQPMRHRVINRHVPFHPLARCRFEIRHAARECRGYSQSACVRVIFHVIDRRMRKHDARLNFAHRRGEFRKSRNS